MPLQIADLSVAPKRHVIDSVQFNGFVCGLCNERFSRHEFVSWMGNGILVINIVKSIPRCLVMRIPPKVATSDIENMITQIEGDDLDEQTRIPQFQACDSAPLKAQKTVN